MIGRYFRAALIFLVTVLLDIIIHQVGGGLLDVAEGGNPPADAPPLVTWGQFFLDWFTTLVLLSLLVYLLVGAWRENQATRY